MWVCSEEPSCGVLVGDSGELVGLYLEGEILRKVKGSEKEGDSWCLEITESVCSGWGQFHDARDADKEAPSSALRALEELQGSTHGLFQTHYCIIFLNLSSSVLEGREYLES